ncbi:MAG: hypothetical protein ACM3Z4_15265 [Hyphomicrobiales bacterium]
MSKLSYSYLELVSMYNDDSDVLNELAENGMLDDETLARAEHLGRFFRRVREACRNPNLKVGDHLSDDEVQRIFDETAEKGADVGRCPPLLH